MNRAWWASLALAGAAASPLVLAQSRASSKEFVVALPPGIDTARTLVLELRAVRLPRNAAVVLRARIAQSEPEVPLGSIGVLAQSKDATGTAEHAALRIDVTRPLARWRQDHPGDSAIHIRVVPYAGAEPLAALEWSVASAVLTPGR